MYSFLLKLDSPEKTVYGRHVLGFIITYEGRTESHEQQFFVK
jgi:hypothetical protein